MEFRNLLIEIAGGVATLTINRPQSLNALNREVVTELGFALNWLEQDAAVKVVIVTGAGEKAFVAGGDIKEMAAINPCQAHAFAHAGQRVMLSIRQMKKPVIAAVNG
ncbi:MAG: enoyl-CoA hydratase-related protein, partial [Desulfuromonadaceae bacterium]